mmetsp:Transcript_4398/g.10175  ORF Transcript_4398/g.10175 Transcript_4398/m.10175 type:complete len:208 (-) Transcript_4398:5-628(-)
MLPCTPVANARSMFAFSRPSFGQPSLRSMTFCTTRQTLPSAVSRALAIMPRTCSSLGSHAGAEVGRTAAAASLNAAGSSRCWQAISSCWQSLAVVTVSRTSAMSSGSSSSICSIDATWTSCSAALSSVVCQRGRSSHEPDVSTSAARPRRATRARSTAGEQPSGMKTCTMAAASASAAFAAPEAFCASCPAGPGNGARHSEESADST